MLKRVAMNQHERRPDRVAERGVTLVEMLIVVAIMSLVASGIAVAAYKYWSMAQIKTATANARSLRGLVKAWWLANESGECPTLDDLIRSGGADEDTSRVDPWGSAWRIECDGARVSVSSDGPDRKAGTTDDIRVPPIERQPGSPAPSGA